MKDLSVGGAAHERNLPFGLEVHSADRNKRRIWVVKRGWTQQARDAPMRPLRDESIDGPTPSFSHLGRADFCVKSIATDRKKVAADVKPRSKPDRIGKLHLYVVAG